MANMTLPRSGPLYDQTIEKTCPLHLGMCMIYFHFLASEADNSDLIDKHENMKT